MQLEKARVVELSLHRATRQNSLPLPTSSARWNNVANNNNIVTKNNRVTISFSSSFPSIVSMISIQQTVIFP